MAFGRQLHQAKVRISHSSPIKCKFRTTIHACANFAQPTKHLRISHQPMCLWCEISSVLPTPHQIFSFVFFDVNSFLIPLINQSQALLCKDYKRGGNHLSNQMLCFTLSKIQGSLCFPFLSTIFFFLEVKQPLRMFSQRMRG